MTTRRRGSCTAVLLVALCTISTAGQLQSPATKIEPLRTKASAAPHSSAQTLPVAAKAASASAEEPPPDTPPKPKRVLSCTLTAYTAGYESTGKRPGDPGYGITACGKIAREGQTIAVDPAVIPIGTHVYIDGIGERQAEDTGGAVKGAHIDVFFNDPRIAIQFGVKTNVPVYISQG
ncbi:MAG: peptidoglycan-binding protein [Bacilli bacterium]|nr:peptidoglycan-binding protein [Bacilli bacterium]